MTTISTFYPDNLVLHEMPENTFDGVILSGEDSALTVRGCVLGVITSGINEGKYRVWNETNVDGSEIPNAILYREVDATAGDKVCTVYSAGTFDENHLTIDPASALTLANKEILRNLGIYIKKGLTVYE